MQAKITSLSISNWYGNSPEGTFTFQHDSGTITHKLDKEEVERIWALCYEAIERTKSKIAGEIQALQPPALLGYDRTKTIESAGNASEDIQPPPPAPVDDDEIVF